MLRVFFSVFGLLSQKLLQNFINFEGYGLPELLNNEHIHKVTTGILL